MGTNSPSESPENRRISIAKFNFHFCSKAFFLSPFLAKYMQCVSMSIIFCSDKTLSQSMVSTNPHYFLHKKGVIQLYAYITYFTVTIKTYSLTHQKRDRFVVSIQMCYTVIFLFLEKDFPEDNIYGRSRNLHYPRVCVLTRKHVAFWSWAVLDIP